ncbi:hypothetical protein BJ878DRAFT_296886 [Calycina marina]|uniref:Protein kish n=1 Tax=Calycina marina TaxID=1763456 RepID=A0A9P7Z6Q3_9HELO|nr:hypothetical protein BJ878DRAFT_296886 [Calycina marina]
MTALFNFESALLCLLLLICTCTYAHGVLPGWMDRNKEGAITGFFWKAARVGERLSPYMGLCCLVMAVNTAVHQGSLRVLTRRRVSNNVALAGVKEMVLWIRTA